MYVCTSIFCALTRVLLTSDERFLKTFDLPDGKQLERILNFYKNGAPLPDRAVSAAGEKLNVGGGGAAFAASRAGFSSEQRQLVADKFVKREEYTTADYEEDTKVEVIFRPFMSQGQNAYGGGVFDANSGVGDSSITSPRWHWWPASVFSGLTLPSVHWLGWHGS